MPSLPRVACPFLPPPCVVCWATQLDAATDEGRARHQQRRSAWTGIVGLVAWQSAQLPRTGHAHKGRWSLSVMLCMHSNPGGGRDRVRWHRRSAARRWYLTHGVATSPVCCTHRRTGAPSCPHSWVGYSARRPAASCCRWEGTLLTGTHGLVQTVTAHAVCSQSGGGLAHPSNPASTPLGFSEGLRGCPATVGCRVRTWKIP